MAESSEELKSMLSSLLTRFDESKLAGDKQAEAQIAFNKQVSVDLALLRRQVDLTQADVDEVRQQRQTAPPPPATSPRGHPPCTPRGGPLTGSFAAPVDPHAPQHRLVNNGPPLLQLRHGGDRVDGPHPGDPAPGHHDMEMPRQEEYFAKPPKHDFP
ncbi:hypothetical protein VPH35_071018 [Triticum aestivum]